MKRFGQNLFCATCLLFFVVQVYAAKAKSKGSGNSGKDVWVSEEKNGTVFTTDSNGEFNLPMGEEVDLSGYKYLQVECSSPDGKKFSRLDFYFGFAPEENEDYDWDQSGKISVMNVAKTNMAYQGLAYGKNMCFEDTENGKRIFRNPEATRCMWISVAAYDANWKRVPNVKVCIRKITATNTALGKVYKIDTSKDRFFKIDYKTVWDHDKSNHYGHWIDLKEALGALPKAGDIVQLRIKGTNAFGMGPFRAVVFNESNGWTQVSTECCERGFAKGEKVDETIDLVILKDASDMNLEILTYEDESDFSGPYIIYAK
ncbi:MAG: hypothetical protein IJJ66_07470 [Treponema sp.]|nr:hypothetical protein [Treponema sp.]MBR0476638.1 hypothetical protein [Treponema sp.]